jgi:ribonuclease D
MQIIYVESESDLNSAIQLMVMDDTYLAIDTEFRREDTYFPQLCLIQVATKNHIFLIDALKVQDISPFFNILTDKNILKVLHSGRQDLEIFCYLMQGKVTTPVFDTQIAAMLAGYGESAGFESLASKLLGTSLDKSSRHTNWMKRPLDEKQKTYAVNDVLYLRPLYELLVQKLTDNKRLDWMKDEVTPLESADFLITVPSQAWRKFKAAYSSPRSLALLQYLAEWRENTAQRMDTPRSWLLKDEVIIEIATRKHLQIDNLKKIPHFPKDDTLILDEVWAIVQTVLEMPEDRLPIVEKLPILSQSQHRILEMLKILLNVIADSLNINPKLIAEKENLIKWVANKGVLSIEDKQGGWRDEVFWQKAKDLLDGKLKLHIHKGHLKIEDCNNS